MVIVSLKNIKINQPKRKWDNNQDRPQFILATYRGVVIVKKCKFYTKKTDFIGFIIKLRQISMDLKKIKAIVNQ